MIHKLSVGSVATYGYGYVDGVWSEIGTEWVAQLPHSCDEWVVGSGDKETVLAALKQMRSEIDEAITFLAEQPQRPAKAYENGWRQD